MQLCNNTINKTGFLNHGFFNMGFCGKKDNFGTPQKCRLQKDTFDKTNNTMDIYSKNPYPANVLSNFANNEFYYDGVYCASMEGFLQSLKTKDIEKQKQICALYGKEAKNTSQENIDWLRTQKLYWNGKEYDRSSKEFKELVFDAYKNCYDQNEIFKTALNSTKGMILTHKIGKSDETKTILTEKEFIYILTELRDSYNQPYTKPKSSRNVFK